MICRCDLQVGSRQAWTWDLSSSTEYSVNSINSPVLHPSTLSPPGAMLGILATAIGVGDCKV